MSAGANDDYGAAEFKSDLERLGVADSRETTLRVETHRRLLAEWSERMNLVGPKELDHFWRRHAFDSAQIAALAPTAKRWVDLGSGAGFPGLVIAAILAGRPGAEIHLVESTAKKANFLATVIAEAKLPARVFNTRIEAFGAGPREEEGGAYDVVTARALAPLPRLIDYAKPILARGAIGLFHKGADLDAELAAAADALRGGGTQKGAPGGGFRADVLESASDPRGRIVRISKAA